METSDDTRRYKASDIKGGWYSKEPKEPGGR